VAIVVNLPDLLRDFPFEDDDLNRRSSDDPIVLSRCWLMILLLAGKDHATSVQYHPWRENGGLSYVVDGVRHFLEEPPVEEGETFVAVARSLFTEPGWIARLRRQTGPGWLAHLRRLPGLGWPSRRRPTPSAVCATFGMDLGSQVFLWWDVVVWSTGQRSGVELFEVKPDATQRAPQAGS
jgi:hypothetical protein